MQEVTGELFHDYIGGKGISPHRRQRNGLSETCCVRSHYPEVTLAASWPAKSLYEKRGYKENGFHMIPAAYNDFLCYDDMAKEV